MFRLFSISICNLTSVSKSVKGQINADDAQFRTIKMPFRKKTYNCRDVNVIVHILPIIHQIFVHKFLLHDQELNNYNVL